TPGKEALWGCRWFAGGRLRARRESAPHLVQRAAEESVLLGRAERHSNAVRSSPGSQRPGQHTLAPQPAGEVPRILSDIEHEEVRPARERSITQAHHLTPHVLLIVQRGQRRGLR